MTTDTSTRLWCIYEHLATFEVGKPPVLIYVNACPLSEVYSLYDGRRNTEWIRMFSNGAPVHVRILDTTTTFYEARRKAADYIRTLREIPICNLRGINIKSTPQRIRCSNGEVYETQKIAAAALGVQPSAISRHLRGVGKSVSGYTFEFVNLGER
jgi:dipeptidyl aminopeptidase/acylaminoacyl peptidase